MGALSIAACGDAGHENLFGYDGAGGHGSASANDAIEPTTDAGTPPDSGSEPSQKPCVPGHSTSCACAGGLVGVQKCLPSGEGYEACECPLPDGGDPSDAGPDAPEEDSGPNDAGPDAPNWGDGGVCAPAQCIPEGVMGINCDPDCGPVSSQCSTACGSTNRIWLTPGILWVRTPPVSEKLCTSCGKDPYTGQEPNLWAMGFRLKAEPYCLTITGPDGAVARSQGWGAPSDSSPSVCHAGLPIGPGCASYRQPSPLTGHVGDIMIGLREPSPGALFRIELRMDQSCPEAQCVGGCNGDGALYL